MPASEQIVLALDIGTSSARVTGFDARGERVPGLMVSEEHEVRTTSDGGAELDAEELVERSLRLLQGALALVPAGRPIAAVGVCTFWHSVLGVGDDERALTPVYTWADTRSARDVESLRERLDEQAVHARTGCLFHSSYVPAKLLWLGRTQPEVMRRAKRWVSPGEYLFLRLFGAPHCSVSTASGTGLLDQGRMVWDEEVLAALPIDAEHLSTIVDLGTTASGLSDEVAARLPRLRDVPWVPAVGDGAASNVGSGCVSPARVALMLGTSGAMRALAPGKETQPPEGLWVYRVDRERPLVGGALSNGGNVYSWLHETLRVADHKAVEAELASLAPDAHGLTVLPFLAGERAVGWRGDARAAIVGLSWSTRPIEILRAGMEAVALRFSRVYERLRPLVPAEHTIIASGGLLRSPTWMQMIADALGEPLVASEEAEASSRGVALLALEALGLLGLGDAEFPLGRRFEPDADRHARYRTADARQRRLYEALLVESDVGSVRT